MNCDTFIKQELPTVEEEFPGIIPGTDLNILVKNEPISDVPFSAVTIKDEPLTEATFFMETIPMKTEQNQEALTRPRDGFVIYELETQMQATGKEISKELSHSTTSQIQIKNATETPKRASLITNLNQSNLLNTPSVDEIATKLASPPPILLNDKLRKRHKVVIPSIPADKRKRYNIENTASGLLGKSNTAVHTITETSKTCRLLNTGNKKIINHLMKCKQKEKPKEWEENSTKPKTPINIQNNKIGNAKSEQQTTITTQTQSGTVATNSPTISPSLAATDILTNAQKLTDSPIGVPELRVKCLCSLTDDTTSDNTELKYFFEEMFRQTKCLSKTQQRKVKMSLLTAICSAEDAVEQGKCCGF